MRALRVPTRWGAGCRYCTRYHRACGRHEVTPVSLTTDQRTRLAGCVEDRIATALADAQRHPDDAEAFTADIEELQELLALIEG